MRLSLLLAVLALLPALPAQAQSLGAASCVGGIADEDSNPATTANNFPCNQVDLLARLTVQQLGAPNPGSCASPYPFLCTNEVGGWTDPENGHEIAIVGLSNGVAFVDVSTPTAPVYLGRLPQPSGVSVSTWHTFRVYNDHVFIGSEASGHGIQVFSLAHLRGVTSPPVTFTQDARYTGNSNAHTLDINEATGYLYVAGSTQSNPNSCSGGGLHIVDVRNPLTPVFAGCYDARGYTHEAQCLTYNGPDTDYTGRSLCFQYQGSSRSVSIVDVTNPAAPAFISETTYPASNGNYSHQGWLTDDGRFVLIDDEFDNASLGTRTIVMDVSDLDDPTHVGSYYGPLHTYAHNLYVRGHYAYESNYTGGLHIVDISSGNPATFTEAGAFDTHPSNNNLSYSGQWHNYPYFASGIVLATDGEFGFFVLRPTATQVSTEHGPAAGFSLSQPAPSPTRDATRLTLSVGRAEHVRAEALDALGRRVAVLFDGTATASAPTTLTFETAGLPAGPYLV
ncbi:MAG TPA: choice-of-anchor B family protein, partial [Rhodothermales bacterium]|nr:choice-of-anchor B family protein [Rhodothermales bacterium]